MTILEKLHKIEKAKITLQYIHSKLYSIGAPLNDNILKFNNKQLKYLIDIAREIELVV